MVKVKLIEDRKYFQLMFRFDIIMLIRRIMLLVLIAAFPVVYFRISLGIVLLKAGLVLTIASQLIGSLWLINHYGRLKSLAGNKIIEIDKDQLSIKSSDQNIVDKIEISPATKITFHKSPALPDHSLLAALKGVQENFISLHNTQQDYTYYIEFDSHYMIEQFKKLVDQWTISGTEVVRV